MTDVVKPSKSKSMVFPGIYCKTTHPNDSVLYFVLLSKQFLIPLYIHVGTCRYNICTLYGVPISAYRYPRASQLSPQRCKYSTASTNAGYRPVPGLF